MSAIFVLWQLNAPFSTVLVGVIFPCRNDPFLKNISALSDKAFDCWLDLEQIIVGLLWQLRGGYDIIIQSTQCQSSALRGTRESGSSSPPELFYTIEADDTLDVFHPALSSCYIRGRSNGCLGKRRNRSLRHITTFGSGRVEPQGPGRI